MVTDFDYVVWKVRLFSQMTTPGKHQPERLKSCLAGPGNFLLLLQAASLYSHGLPLNMLTKLLPLSLWELMRSQPRKTVSFIKIGTWKLNQFLKFVSLVTNPDRSMGLNFFFYCINAEQTLIKTKHICELLSLSFQETASWYIVSYKYRSGC